MSLRTSIELALANDPNVALVETQVLFARGNLLIAAGEFDLVIDASLGQSDLELPATETTSTEERTLVYNLGLSQKLRSGLVLEPGLELVRSDDGVPISNQGIVSWVFRQPLLRGRGRATTTATERAAEQELSASQLDLRQTLAERLRAVAVQYWQTLSAVFNLEILRLTEERSRDLLETTRRLVEADVTPAADLIQVEADLAAREAARIEGEGMLFAARQDLGREIGLEPAALASLPAPTDSFPELIPEGIPPAETAFWIDTALDARADLLAARARLEAAEILLRAADNLLKPQLDLVLEPSYSSLVEGSEPGDFFAPLLRNVPGLSTSLVLDFSWPVRNRQARGERTLREAARQENELRIELLERQIGAEVPTALDGARRGAQQLVQARRAVELFEQAVENEEKKLRAGTSTLLDVLSQRDRLTAARQREVAAQLALALALVELRFQTGTLLERDGQPAAESAERLITLPARGSAS